MLNSEFIKPKYNRRCFSDIPPMLKYMLSGKGDEPPLLSTLGNFPKRYDTVVVIFADAFGWSFFQRHKDNYPFLRRFTQSPNGKAVKITSQFPSTTAAHVTTIHTGLPPAQSGIFEWQYFEPALDAVIAPLLFSFSGTKERDTLLPTGINPKSILPTATLYHQLNALGIKSHIYQYRAYTPSSYSDVLFDGANVHPYATFSEAFVNMRECIQNTETPAYFFMYFPQIDSICHTYGPDSPQTAAEIDTFLTTLENSLMTHLDKGSKNTLFMMIADHGQMEVNPETTVYLNRDARFAGIERFIKRNKAGDLIVPAGSARDMFLYIYDEMLDEAQTFLQKGLTGIADVVKTNDLITEGYFGPDSPSAAFEARVGNLVILPFAKKTVWWFEKDKFEMELRGHHGGLSPEEMETPLLLYRF